MKNQKIGLIGLGSMGGEMALKFLAAGHDLTVYDINPERLAPSINVGAKVADSSAELTQKVDLVMTSSQKLRHMGVSGKQPSYCLMLNRGRSSSILERPLPIRPGD